jgi:hypothetical protein
LAAVGQMDLDPSELTLVSGGACVGRRFAFLPLHEDPAMPCAGVRHGLRGRQTWHARAH